MPASFPDIPELAAFKKLTTPAKVQDFLDGIPMNFEVAGETCRSPLFVLRHNEAHCMEGALLAAAIFWARGQRPFLLDLKVARGKGDYDHVVTLFKQEGRWGAVSKTNHAVLRYREPVYKSVRELAMSYFHEYFLDTGEKTLRSYSAPFSLSRFGTEWLTAEEDQWEIAAALDDVKHYEVAPAKTVKRFRRADAVEIATGKITEWKEKTTRRKS